LIIEVYCSKDAAARVLVPSNLECNSSKRGGLSAFSTNLTKSHGFFDSNQIELCSTLGGRLLFLS
jgi:hypothetical protein